VRSHIDIARHAAQKINRAHMVEKCERSHHAPLCIRKHTADREPAQAAPALIDDDFEHETLSPILGQQPRLRNDFNHNI
jgi:hypothetical protein